MEHKQTQHEFEDYDFPEREGFTLQCGKILAPCSLAYKTFGKLNQPKDNAVVICCGVTSSHNSGSVLHWTKPDSFLMKMGYFVVTVGKFCDGFSSSPSNQPHPHSGPNFPKITNFDNVTAQHKLITEHLDINKVKLVTGFASGAQQALQWASLYPNLVECVLPVMGTAKTSSHNKLVLRSVCTAIKADPKFKEGNYTNQPPLNGLLSAGAVWATWAVSHDYFRLGLSDKNGFPDMEAYMETFEGNLCAQDANDLLCQLDTWMSGDISDNGLFKGDLKKALQNIRAKTLVVACDRDMKTYLKDCEGEAAQMTKAESVEESGELVRVLDSPLGHFAGMGLDGEVIEFFHQAAQDLLATERHCRQ